MLRLYWWQWHSFTLNNLTIFQQISGDLSVTFSTHILNLKVEVANIMPKDDFLEVTKPCV